MDFPLNIKAATQTLLLRANTQSYESPLTRSVQTASLQGDRWEMTVSYSNKYGAEAKQLKSFIFQLRGQAGRFDYIPPDLDQQGQGTAAITVNGANQLGDTLNIQTTDFNTILFEVGDYLSVNSELKYVTSQSVSDGSGLASVTFEPPLRRSPADNAPVEYEAPKVTMKLEDEDQAQFQVSSPIIYNASFSFIEAF